MNTEEQGQTLDQITTELREFYSLAQIADRRTSLHAEYCNLYFGNVYPKDVFEAHLMDEYRTMRKKAIEELVD